MKTRHVIIGIVLLLAVTIAGACYYLYGREYVYRFTAVQLTDALARKLPLEKTYLFVFHVVLDHPRVTLVDGSDRVNVTVDVAVNLRLGEDTQLLAGTIDGSAGIRYEPATAQFFLDRPAIDKAALENVPEKYASRISAVLTEALTDYYALRPVYTLPATTARMMAARLLLKSVRVEHGELVARLGVGG